MDEACKLRLQRLELDYLRHDQVIREQGIALHEIVQVLMQIRWMGVGALGLFVLQNIGLLEVVKKLIGL